jgi:hypothetical protein
MFLRDGTAFPMVLYGLGISWLSCRRCAVVIYICNTKTNVNSAPLPYSDSGVKTLNAKMLQILVILTKNRKILVILTEHTCCFLLLLRLLSRGLLFCLLWRIRPACVLSFRVLSPLAGILFRCGRVLLGRPFRGV